MKKCSFYMQKCDNTSVHNNNMYDRQIPNNLLFDILEKTIQVRKIYFDKNIWQLSIRLDERYISFV